MLQFHQAGFAAGRGLALESQRQDITTHAPVAFQPVPGLIESGLQIALVEHDQHRDALGFGRDQRARELAFGELGVGRDQHQDLVEVGGEGLGAHLVLPVKQVAPGVHAFDAAFVARGLPLHMVAHDHLALLSARVADAALSVRAFHQAVPSVGRHHQPGKGAGRL
ncbi:hypothetical protein FQZ97_1027040 [compost metagenome]